MDNLWGHMLREAASGWLRWSFDVYGPAVTKAIRWTASLTEKRGIRRWSWIDLVLWMHSSLPRAGLTCTPEGKRKKGRPRETWRRTVEKEYMAMGYCSWAEGVLAAADKMPWRSTISGSTLHTEKRQRRRRPPCHRVVLFVSCGHVVIVASSSSSYMTSPSSSWGWCWW